MSDGTYEKAPGELHHLGLFALADRRSGYRASDCLRWRFTLGLRHTLKVKPGFSG